MRLIRRQDPSLIDKNNKSDYLSFNEARCGLKALYNIIIKTPIHDKGKNQLSFGSEILDSIDIVDKCFEATDYLNKQISHKPENKPDITSKQEARVTEIKNFGNVMKGINYIVPIPINVSDIANAKAKATEHDYIIENAKKVGKSDQEISDIKREFWAEDIADLHDQSLENLTTGVGAIIGFFGGPPGAVVGGAIGKLIGRKISNSCHEKIVDRLKH